MSAHRKLLTRKQRKSMHDAVEDAIGSPKARLWWKARNPMFGGVSPVFMVKMGLERRVHDFVILAKEMNSPPPVELADKSKRKKIHVKRQSEVRSQPG